jgi:hypothetical protein
VDTDNAVANLNHRAHVGHRYRRAKLLNLLLYY